MGASDSKLAFKQNVFALAGREDISYDDPLWEEFCTLPESAEDVFSLWSPNDLGCLTLGNKDVRPPPDSQVEPKKNLETLIYVLVARLYALQKTHVYDDDQRATNSEILNCMRILTRLMPFIYEAPHLEDWCNRFFWEPRRPTYYWDKRNDKPGRLFDGLDPSRKYAMEDFDTEIAPPLGCMLLQLCVSFLFFAGFTVPTRVDANGKPDLSIAVKVWQTGIGNNRSIGCTKDNEKNQQETVRLLLAICSQTMYMSPSEIPGHENRALTYLTTSPMWEKRVINGTLCSLLNTVLKYNPNTWGVPIEMAIGSSDSKKLLVTNCLQLVLVLMMYVPPASCPPNHFWQSMASLHRPDDFQFIQQGMSLVLGQPVSGTYGPLSKDKALPWAPEMIGFLWELVQCNKRFRRYLIDTSCALDYVILVLWYVLDAKEDAAKQGVLRLCIFFLQTMSTESKFAESLNCPFRHPETLPSSLRIPNFHGSYADFLISTIHTLLTTNRSRLESVYPALVAIIKSIAPKQRCLARATSSKLMNMFEKFAAPSFVLANDSNHIILLELLDAMNAFLERPLHENRKFIEVLISSARRFKALRGLTLEGAFAEFDRQAQDNKDRGDLSSLRTPTSQTSSFESARGQNFVRSPSMSNMPEDDRFAIGEDDEDADTEDMTPRPVDRDEVDPSLRSLSEKARGKQPAVLNTGISSTSNGTPNARLSYLGTSHPPSTSQTVQPHSFRPSQEWLDSWLPQLPLEKIFHIIHLAETKQLDLKAATLPLATSELAMNTDASGGDSHQISGEVRSRSVQLTKRPGEGETSHERYPRSTGQAALAEEVSMANGGFQWTSLTIGWYSALVWSRVYLTEAEAFHGSGGLYSNTNVLLFKRDRISSEISLRRPKGAIDAVGDSLAKRISSIGIK